MYRWLRNTHLFAGLFAFLFVLMYGVSSIGMAHESWFPNRPVISETRVPISPLSGDSARGVALELMNRHHIRGELRSSRATADGFNFWIGRPGTNYQVEYSRTAGEARVQKRVASLMAKLEQVHEVAGLDHADWLLNAWGVFVALVSVGLIILALTGIYLWFKIHAERLTGAVLLLLSLGYSITVMFLLRGAE